VILYFLRHGKAGHHSGAADDDERQLTDAGVAELKAAAPLWRRLNLRPDLVLSSPLPRALQTAQLLIEGLGISGAPVVDDRLRPGAGWGDLPRRWQLTQMPTASCSWATSRTCRAAMSLLTGASSVRMRKGGSRCVEFPGVPEPGSASWPGWWIRTWHAA
jgi:phosphohistidine phosphatase